MKELYLKDLVPGMRVAREVYNPSNYHIILQAGNVLTDTMISRLQLHGIHSVFVEEETIILEVDRQGEIEVYSETIRKSPEFAAFKQAYDTTLVTFKNTFYNVIEKQEMNQIDDLMGQTMSMVELGRSKIGVLHMLMNMREYDDSTFSHSMNVALLCNLMASWLHMDYAQVELATLCGLMHDVGKMKVSREIITKPSSLTPSEYAQVQRHTIAGFEVLRELKMDEHVCNAALMHHERIDGSGYPLRLKGGQIDPYAKITAIADVYDAMTAARVYRGPLCPFRVIELFEKEGYDKYDVEYLLSFLENVADSFMQNRCRLSDGREGDIIFINRDKISRPIVQTTEGCVNLTEQTELYIETLL